MSEVAGHVVFALRKQEMSIGGQSRLLPHEIVLLTFKAGPPFLINSVKDLSHWSSLSN